MLYYNFLLIFHVLFGVDGKNKYCAIKDKFCHGKPHILCGGHDSTVQIPTANQCSEKTLIPLNDEMKSFILEVHNKYRNQIASGKLPGYPSASRMKTMHWSEELQETAEGHVAQCAFAHDACRATSKYEFSGQNIAIRMSSHENHDYKGAMSINMERWWVEYDLVPHENRLKLIEHYLFDAPTGHFYAMIREINNEVGCAFMIYKNNEANLPYQTLFTCNYPETNMIEEQVYDVGSPCSRCDGYGSDYKCDKTFQGMCDHKDWGSNKLKKGFANRLQNIYWLTLLTIVFSHCISTA